MKVVKKDPPNFSEIYEAFDVRGRSVVFTYGDTIYAPRLEGEIPDHLMVHEETHSKQQGENPDAWWGIYIRDRTFRLSQEVEAYQNQYKYFISTEGDRNKRALFLHEISSHLSGSIYGNLVEIKEAKRLIKNE